MKSIKPGRGPSAMGAVGSIAVGVFGIIWTFGAASMGAPSFFVLFGIVFIGISVLQAAFHFKNATGKNRMSVYDITEKEPDPIDSFLNRDRRLHEEQDQQGGFHFCPYCGNKVADDSYHYCPNCGKKISR